MKIILFHTNTNKDEIIWHKRRESIWKKNGYDIEVIGLPINLKFSYYNELTRRIKRKEEKLLSFHSYLLLKINMCDVFIHFGGGMIHSSFIKKIDKKVKKIYHCADDPESSNILSKPIAKYYDYCAISNIAELDRYKYWGCKNVFFWPLGSLNYDENKV